MEKYLRKSFTYTKVFFICAIALAFLGGAAMAFETAVTHQDLGKAVFALSFVFSFAYIFEYVAAKANPNYAKDRDQLKGIMGRYFGFIAISFFLAIITIVTLVLH